MQKENLYQPFEIEYRELDEFPKMSRSNNFFELIYIIDGTGVQYINKNRFNYRKGNLFLITPQDTHSFEITAITRFFFLRFNEYYVSAKSEKYESVLETASNLGKTSSSYKFVTLFQALIGSDPI